MKGQSFLRRLGFALSGMVLAWRNERSFRTQAVIATLALGALIALRPSPLWWALVLLACAGVLAAELFNAAIEHLCDHLHPDRHPAIKAVKDMAAGAVLVACLGAAAIGILLLISVATE